MKNFIFVVILFLGASSNADDGTPINLTSLEILTKGKVLASGGISGNEPFSELKIVVHYLDEIFFCVTKLRVIHPRVLSDKRAQASAFI